MKDTVKNLTEQISEVKEIKSFLEDNRKKYTKAFDDLDNKINNVMKDNIDVQMNNTKALHNDIESIGEQFTKKLFDPNYRLRMNNIRWRKNNRTVSNYINHES